MLFCTDNCDFEIGTTSQRSPQGRSQEIQKAPFLNLKRVASLSLAFRGTGVARKYGPGGPPVPPCPKVASSPVPHPPQRKGRASRFWPLRSRLGAGGARRRSTPPTSQTSQKADLAQQKFKNQKPSLVWEQEDYNPTESFHRAKQGMVGRGAPLVT